MQVYRPILPSPSGLGNILYFSTSMYEEDLIYQNDISRVMDSVGVCGVCIFHIYDGNSDSVREFSAEAENIHGHYVFSFMVGTVKHTLSIYRNDYWQEPFSTVGFFRVDASGYYEVRFE